MDELKNLLGSASQVLDPYARQARLAPALIALFPLALILVVWLPALRSVLGGLVSLGAAFGILLWLSQIARDEGKKKEADLYRQWGGKPSVVLLCASDTRIDRITKARYRKFLTERVEGLTFPSDEEERRDPGSSESACESATAWLLTQTRDTRRFELLFQENISYGFRRNLWGLRPVGFIIALGGSVFSSGLILFLILFNHGEPRVECILATLILWAMAAWWAFRVNELWVKLAADAYAIQLLAACDTLKFIGQTKDGHKEQG
jgi:hypothetical protein